MNNKTQKNNTWKNFWDSFKIKDRTILFVFISLIYTGLTL